MNVAVLGAGATGRTVARRSLAAGHQIHLVDDDANVVMDCIDEVEQAVDDSSSDDGQPDERQPDERKTDERQPDDPQADDRRADVESASIRGTTDLEAAVTEAALVVDATDDDVAGRRALFARIEEHLPAGCIVATTDPSVSVTAVAAGLRRPTRAVGLHFVPSAADPVVEVVVADQTSEPSLERAVEFVEGLDCVPLVVRDAPGFVVTRLDLAVIAEAARLVGDEIARVRDVDRSLERSRGHPDGPLAMADRIGLDGVLAALEDLQARLGDRFEPPGVLWEKVAAGRLGVATGEGFYRWENGERGDPADPYPVIEARSDEPIDPDDQ